MAFHNGGKLLFLGGWGLKGCKIWSYPPIWEYMLGSINQAYRHKATWNRFPLELEKQYFVTQNFFLNTWSITKGSWDRWMDRRTDGRMGGWMGWWPDGSFSFAPIFKDQMKLFLMEALDGFHLNSAVRWPLPGVLCSEFVFTALFSHICLFFNLFRSAFHCSLCCSSLIWVPCAQIKGKYPISTITPEHAVLLSNKKDRKKRRKGRERMSR